MRPEIVISIQAFYFGITGLWPILHMRSFLRITGPKTDLWLVRTVGLLILVVAATQGYAIFAQAVQGSVVALSVLSAAILLLVDVIYTAKKTISPVYLIDAGAELGLLGLWAAVA